MGAIFRRELGSFFSSSIAYVFLASFYRVSGYFFCNLTLGNASSDMSGMFSSLLLIIVVLIPILTMKSFSEEKRQKTDQGLLTAPVSLGGIVLGKYFAVVVMYIMGISIVFLYALVLSYFGDVAWNMVVANYFALLLLGCAFISVGMMISSLTENQIVAAVISFFALLFMYLLDVIANYVKFDFLADVLNSLSYFNKFYEFTCGLFNLTSVLYYISTAVIFNFLTIRIFERRRWS